MKHEVKKYQESTTILHAIQFDELSPKKAFDVLWQWKESIDKGDQ
jgi:hypothetical protein